MGNHKERDFAAVAKLLLDAGSPLDWQAPQPEPAEGINEIIAAWRGLGGPVDSGKR
jgi:hypothetical protein